MDSFFPLLEQHIGSMAQFSMHTQKSSPLFAVAQTGQSGSDFMGLVPPKRHRSYRDAGQNASNNLGHEATGRAPAVFDWQQGQQSTHQQDDGRRQQLVHAAIAQEPKGKNLK